MKISEAIRSELLHVARHADPGEAPIKPDIVSLLEQLPEPSGSWEWSDRALVGVCWIAVGNPSRALRYLLADWTQAAPAAAGVAGAYLLDQGLLAPALPALQTAVGGQPDDVEIGRAHV